MPAHFTPPEADHAGEFRSKLVAANGEIVSTSEGYTDWDTAHDWPADMLRWVIEANTPLVKEIIAEYLNENARRNQAPLGDGEAWATEIIDRLTATIP